MEFLEESKQPEPYFSDIHKFVGCINISDGIVDITDPCYDDDTWCARFGHKVKPGIYKCYIDVINYPYKYICQQCDYAVLVEGHNVGDLICCDDHRIMQLTIIHEDNDFILNNDEYPDIFELIDNNIGVDAGLCGFYNHKPNLSGDDWDKFWQNLDEYKGCTCDCNHGNGITVSSGFGDGSYSLYEIKYDNEVCGLQLVFSEEEEE